MALNRSKNVKEEGLTATVALAMAFYEQTGLRELIDSKFDIDCRQKLTPGNAVKALIGDMMGLEGRRPLYSVHNPFKTAPNDMLFGEKVDIKSLGGTAFSRNLDQLFTLDLPRLTYECYELLAKMYALTSKVFNIDTTNWTITPVSKDADVEGAAVPERCGHAKDGHNDRLVYTLLSITDENGVVCYERPYDGSTMDCVMDRDAIEFLSENVDPKDVTLIGDCKFATEPLVELMMEKGFGFVTKCPKNFGQKAQERMVDLVQSRKMKPSSIRDGWEIYDTDMECNDTTLRFVAYRTSKDIDASVQYYREQGLKEANSLFNRFSSKMYNCEEDARRDLDDILSRHTDSAYIPHCDIVPMEVNKGYGHRGRPRKGEKPVIKTEYKVDVELEFDESVARRMSKERSVRVLVTNLPRSDVDKDNLREGATADAVLLSYLDQYLVEHAFRLMKDGMRIGRVYIHRPSRENAMSFVCSLATMMTDVIDHVLKSKGIDMTFCRIVDELSRLDLRYDRENGEEYLSGSSDSIDLFMDVVDALGIDTDHLIH
ncbi:MAG: IS1634 family transposase [Candidatus Methanomethylophilaceae archaeon]|nr:IS1634 family transposase [Candidatus Methanomethylophilaceae archaeon]